MTKTVTGLLVAMVVALGVIALIGQTGPAVAQPLGPQPRLVDKPTSKLRTALIDSRIKRLREAQSDADKVAARADLRQSLTTIFDEDMQAREMQVKEIETRVEKLRLQYQERMKVKDQILDLQIKVLENEAAGLGFPVGGAASPSAAADRAGQFHKAYRAQELVGQLMKQGHFVGSPDAKMYAYVESKSANLPAGTAEIRVCDAATGKLLAATELVMPVGLLKFTDEGVATREADGSFTLRVPLRRPRQTPKYEESEGDKPCS